MKQLLFSVLFITLGLWLTACGGGGSPGPSLHEALATLDYTPVADTRHTYAPYASWSQNFRIPVSPTQDEIVIGGDWEPTTPLRTFYRNQGMTYAMGTTRDGAGVERLRNYEHDLITQDDTTLAILSDDGFEPFIVQPTLYYDAAFLDPRYAGLAQALLDSILILNDALPPEFQIVVEGVPDTTFLEEGDILVQLESPSALRSVCGAGAVACATWRSFVSLPATYSAKVYLPTDLDTTTEYQYPRSTIVHELLHALGIHGHVDSIEFPDSILGKAGEFIPNLGYILSRIDREVLQIMYMSQLSTQYNDWEEWSDTNFHLVGRSDDKALNFGVTLFNGLPHPWARGVWPTTDLIDNAALLGTATWTGALLGFSGPSPISGDVELEVRLGTLFDPANEQDLRFRDLYFVNRFENTDLSAESDRWFDTRNIDYKVTVAGNGFLNVFKEGYEPGIVTGAFMGESHEHMGGTLKRTDLIGAFGGTRDVSLPLEEVVVVGGQ